MEVRHRLKSAAGLCQGACRGQPPREAPRFVVLTGGPGAGKTPVLELARQRFCRHVRVLHEAASIVYGGGFPRESDIVTRRAAQRAIYHIQDELERWARELGDSAVVLCDRGTVDGVAYWPGTPESYWEALSTSWEAELSRYYAVICLRTPPPALYRREDGMREESAHQAAELGRRIEEAWSRHPRVLYVESVDLLEKDRQALELIEAQLPEGCRPTAAGAQL